MKKSILLCIFLSVILVFTSCTTSMKLPKNPILFETDYDGENLILKWDNKEYVLYGIFTGNKPVGKCLGYYTQHIDNDEKIYVCKLKNQSEDEWLVDTLALDNCNEGTIYKEKNTTIIPNEIKAYIE